MYKNFNLQLFLPIFHLPIFRSNYIVKDICSKPADGGECQNYTIRWYYDIREERCRQYYYGGCGGNENNFLDEETCMSRCEPKVTTTTTVAPAVKQTKPHEVIAKDLCLQPAEAGECDNYTIRWYFNTEEKRCRQYYYGGCGGNQNNFLDEESCMSRCEQRSVPTTPLSSDDNEAVPKDLCLKPSDGGDCDNYTIRWYFNAEEKQCRQYYYGGCGGNDNNFVDEESCLSRCEQKVTTVSPQIHHPPPSRGDAGDTNQCYLDYDSGPCRVTEARWYYNRQAGICDMFAYGGCGGNGNNFQSVEECENSCGHLQSACSLPAVYGRCQENITRWYYDSRIDGCYEFQYSGCRGNKNNFYTQSECLNHCQRQQQTVEPDINPVIEHNILDICFYMEFYIVKHFVFLYLTEI